MKRRRKRNRGKNTMDEEVERWRGEERKEETANMETKTKVERKRGKQVIRSKMESWKRKKWEE